MIYSIFPQHDTFIEEYSSTRNSGIDAVLEVTKDIIDDSQYNTRMLVKFDLAEVSSSIVSGVIDNPRFFLNMRITEAEEITSEYTFDIYPISQSWSQGVGRQDDTPLTNEGASWYYKTGMGTDDVWLNDDDTYNLNTTGSWSTVAGGGTWYTSSRASQSFSFETGDIRADVTDIVNSWLDGSIPNEGFIIKLTDAEESDEIDYGSSKYFSMDTHTIYVPRLEIGWDDSSWNSGSLFQISGNDYLIYTKNFRSIYGNSEKAKIKISCRENYPTRTYSTSSIYLTNHLLPTSSYYEIRDAHTREVIIPFDDEYTKISANTAGNYFYLWTDQFFPERQYKLVFKTVEDGGSTIKYHDNNLIFKVIK